MRKGVYIALITMLAVFTIRMIYQAVKIKEQAPQLDKISEARKYSKETDEEWNSVAKRMSKKGTGNRVPQLPPGVVEITFNEYSAPSQKSPYAGPYEIYLERGRKILEGDCHGDGNPVSHKLNPGRYVIRVPDRDVSEAFTIYQEGAGRRLIVAVPATGKSNRSIYSPNE